MFGKLPREVADVEDEGKDWAVAGTNLEDMIIIFVDEE